MFLKAAGALKDIVNIFISRLDFKTLSWMGSLEHPHRFREQFPQFSDHGFNKVFQSVYVVKGFCYFKKRGNECFSFFEMRHFKEMAYWTK